MLNPFEGLLVGEPLAAPFARPGSADWSSLTNGAVLSGQTTLSLTFTAAATNLPLARADLFVDGTFFQTMTNLPPAAGNVLSVTLNGFIINYIVPTNATLATEAAGLADALNQQSNLTQVLAFPAGDRIELQSLALSVPGSNVTVSAGSAIGSASSLTTRLIATLPVFRDTVATGYQVVTISNAPVVGDWLQFAFIKTNGDMVTLGVTNTTPGATVGMLAQNLLNLINANLALQSTDGLFASDFFDDDAHGLPEAQFFLYARAPGWLASQILATLTASTNLLATPAGTNPLADNTSDLRPRNHLYLSSGMDSLAVNFACDTTQMPDGYHQLTAVAYEGTSVETQTRVTRNVQFQNTSLTATLAALPAGANATLDQQLQFTVTANNDNISRIELFSTGGSVGVATNQAAAVFAVSATDLGLGLHPFYALVTDQAGHRFQTQTAWYRILPTITLTLTGTPPMLAWPAIPNRQYDVQFTTNLATAFQTVTTITATNSVIQWPISTTGSAGFYRVQLESVISIELSACGWWKMVEREVFADAVAAGNRQRDEIFPDLHRARQIVSQRERGANRGGIGAAGSVRADAFHERRGQKQLGFAVKKNVRGFMRIFQMAAFDERGAAEAQMNFPRRSPHFFDGCRFVAGQNFRLVQVGRDECGQRQKFFLQDFHRRRFQQFCAAGGNQNRVDNQRQISEGRVPRVPDLFLIWDSWNSSLRLKVLKSSTTTEIFSAVNNIPVFTAAGRNSSNTASICRRSIFGEHGSTPRTRRGFCAVRQAMALAPWTPSAANVFKSAWMPAPPPLSEPAMVSATGRFFRLITMQKN